MINIWDKQTIVEFGQKTHQLPVISIYLNTDHREKDAYQKAYLRLKNIFKELKEKNKDESKDIKNMIESFEQEALEWLKGSFRHLKNGTVMFLGWDENLWEIVELPRPVKTTYYFQNEPATKPLLGYLDEYKKLLGIVLSQREAKLYLQYLGEIKEVNQILDTFLEYAKTKDKEGWFPWATPGSLWWFYEKNTRYEGVLRRYVKYILDEIEKLKDSLQFDRIVIFTPEKLKYIVDEEISKFLKNLLSHTFTGNYIKAGKNQIKELLTQVEQKLEREEEEKHIEEIYRNIWNSEYKKGVAWLKNVLDHLNAQAVWYLMLDENIQFPGYKGKETGMLYEKPEDKVTDEELIYIEDLTNEMIEKAIEQDARVNLVPENQKLKELGWAAAMVRFKI